MFTRTETLRRLRLLAAEMKDRNHLARNAMVEVGHRLYPATSLEFPTRDDVYGIDGDDLSYMEPLKHAASDPNVRAHGAIVHVYLSSGFGYDQELRSVCVGWLGTLEAPPAVFDVDGTPVRQVVG